MTVSKAEAEPVSSAKTRQPNNGQRNAARKRAEERESEARERDMRREGASLTGSRKITANSVSDAEGKGSRWIYPLLLRSKKNPPDANEHPADQE